MYVSVYLDNGKAEVRIFVPGWATTGQIKKNVVSHAWVLSFVHGGEEVQSHRVRNTNDTGNGPDDSDDNSGFSFSGAKLERPANSVVAVISNEGQCQNTN